MKPPTRTGTLTVYSLWDQRNGINSKSRDIKVNCSGMMDLVVDSVSKRHQPGFLSFAFQQFEFSSRVLVAEEGVPAPSSMGCTDSRNSSINPSCISASVRAAPP